MQGKADPRLRRNMWCMMCKDTESTELVRIVSKDSIVKAIKLLTDTTILHMPHSRSEVCVMCAVCLLPTASV